MSEKILIIDDDLDTLSLVGLMLQRQGYQISAATNGQQGLDKAFEEDPDLILLDVMMPDMDGIATFKALQAHPETEQIPVILLTAKAQTSEKRQFNDLGVCGVITKPFNSLDLPEQIAKILHWQL